ncbi:taxadiene 5-alpha hydroxylase [Gossypium australe]|uniref:Taxadiene 5-alpha hydroxylase n=1 Tax=Gossypium australe TaxID=47621 RepID=A0A5B6X4H6_9ROSI|nr:taxadiene 5-alpha hydroxylase [Gossypium australe]
MKREIAEYVSTCLTLHLHGIPYSITLTEIQGLLQGSGVNYRNHWNLSCNLVGFHPKTYDKSERVIQVLEDMLRSCVVDFVVNCEKYVPLVKFTYNNNYHASLKMSPFEALYGRRCRTPTCWMEIIEKKIVGLDLVCETKKKVAIIRNHLKATQD